VHTNRVTATVSFYPITVKGRKLPVRFFAIALTATLNSSNRTLFGRQTELAACSVLSLQWMSTRTRSAFETLGTFSWPLSPGGVAGTADAEIEVLSVEDLISSFTTAVCQNTTSYALPAARNSAFVIPDFPVHSTSFFLYPPPKLCYTNGPSSPTFLHLFL